MLSTIVIVDIILLVLIGVWVGWINIVGNTEAKGGAGFVAFVLVTLIAFISVNLALISLIF